MTNQSNFQFFGSSASYYVLDPANPFNDVMRSCNCWEEVAKTARLFLTKPLFEGLSIPCKWQWIGCNPWSHICLIELLLDTNIISTCMVTIQIYVGMMTVTWNCVRNHNLIWCVFIGHALTCINRHNLFYIYQTRGTCTYIFSLAQTR